MPIPEAYPIKDGETPLGSALTAAAALLDRARAAEPSSDPCLQYLGAATMAVRGLANEFQTILIEAESCDWKNATNRQALRKRIGTYVFVQHIQPVLSESLAGIEAGLARLISDAPGFWSTHHLWGRGKQPSLDAPARLAGAISELRTRLADLQLNGPPGKAQFEALMHSIPPPDACENDVRAQSTPIANALGQARTHGCLALKDYTDAVVRIVQQLNEVFE